MKTRRTWMPAAALPLLLILAAAAVRAGAQEEGEKDEPGWSGGTQDEEKKLEPVEYPGIDPEKQTGIAPLIEKAKASKKTVITWPGFQMVHGGSRVFVQMVQGTKVNEVEVPVRVTKPPIKVQGPSLVYEFPKQVVLISNNLNPLVTRSFDTPVDWVRMVRKKGKVYMVLALRVAAEPVREELLTTEDGYHFFFVEFSAGDYLPESMKEKESGAKKVIE